jgi:hypothetical protein
MEMVDGLNWYSGKYYVCNNPSKYADNTESNYTLLSFSGINTGDARKYITKEGLDTGDNTHIFLSEQANGGDANSYICDILQSSTTDWRILARCGGPSWGDYNGMFGEYWNIAVTETRTWFGSRLMYIPQ